MIEIKVDTKGLTAFLTDVEKRQIPFALSKAINATAIDAQEAERRRLREIFTLRRPEWADKSVKITKFAKKSDPSAILAIAPPGADGPNRADVLGKFEDDTEKRPRGHTIAIPIGARRNKRDIITKANRPKAFNFRQIGKAVRGDKRTFIVRTARGAQLILQRSRQGVKALYLLVSRVRITPSLHFAPTVQKTVDAKFAPRFEKALSEALSTMK